MKSRAIVTFFSVLMFFGCQKNTQILDLKTKNLSSLEDEEATPSLADIYQRQLRSGLAVMNNEHVVSFINQRLSADTLRDLEVEVQANQSLFESLDHYLCVNEYLPGYEEAPSEVVRGGGTELPRILVPVTIIENSDPVEHVDSAGNRHIYWHIGYDYSGEPYWSKRGIIYADGRERYFIAQYKECPSIQDELLNEQMEILEREREEAGEESSNVVLPGQSSGFLEYVCTEDDPLNAYSSTEDVEEDNVATRIPRGMQVVRVQGTGSDPFVSERNDHRYIRVQVQPDTENEDTDEIENQRFWVAEELIKQFEDCAQVQTRISYICAEHSAYTYRNDEEIANSRHSGTFTPLRAVHRRYGEYFSKKITINNDGEEVVYVPVSETQVSNDIVWIKESLIPENCPLNPEVPTTFRSSEGHSCVMFANDNFPLESPSKTNYVTDHVTRFGAARDGGRRSHSAVDLYSYYRHGTGSTNSYGGNVRAINRSIVKRVATWGHTTYLVVQSRVTKRSWIYGEVGRVQVRDERPLARDQLVGRTAQLITNNSAYPAMLHLELFDEAYLSGRGHYGSGGRYEGERVDDPTCEVEFMSTRKFGRIWEGS